MALVEQFRRQGDFLFRYRSFFPIPLFIVGLVYFCFTHYYFTYNATPQYLFYVGLGVGLFGQFIRAIIIGYVPKGTSGRNTEKQVADVLNTKGMYSIVRHPLYLGNFFMWLGIALVTGSVWFVITFCLVYWIYYERIMFAEEAFLREKFGETYLEWANGVPSFIPKISQWKSAGTYFSFRNVLKREYIGLFNLLVILFLFYILSELFTNRWYISFNETFDFVWFGIFVFAIFQFIVVRFLHKKTKILQVEGR